MATLPSPPPHALSPEPAYSRLPHPHPDLTMKALLASSLRVLDQPPPPTLREILEAYKARGDGDRDMLLAMLNAKSAEDQRLASHATLHRTLLDFYHAPPLHPVPPMLAMQLSDGPHSAASSAYPHPHHFPSPPASYHHSPPALHDDPAHVRRHHSRSPSAALDPRPSSSSIGQAPRKRRRTSQSPPPRTRASPPPYARHHHSHDTLPPLPYSPTSSGGSPRSRESMAINSLLLTSHSRDEDGPVRHTSSERSTSMGSRDR
ncbi:uncharacterized protein BXZ73DRAFT_79807 [Epithele typhae]|uniref:uncharacterized protein n=1 Tax=Epithele typhae TaxID=378194 RepID=UPI0020085AA1|nr:uncharacterized protein BXZ73DRAFT_79807 [Epithele typhae]KAH9922014.1 hypothetical protein BXZ73DRAFT_79807 [Epithele typhae]